MKNLTAELIAILCGASCKGKIPAGEISSIVTDSRQAEADGLFVAIPGERTDGHNYLEAARALGASCALVEHFTDSELPQLCVPDTAKALVTIAEYYRKQFRIPVVGLSGSVGKTTAKEMIASVLGQRFCTMKTQGNFNNNLGVPLTLFQLRPEHEVAVVEMGISHFGEMNELSRMVQPTAAVLMNIGDAHLEFLGSREGILKEKRCILDFAGKDAPLFVNGDDPLLNAAEFERETVRFGLGEHNDVQAMDVSFGAAELRCILKSGKREIPVRVPAFGDYMLYPALAAAAVGLHLGLTEDEIADGIAAFENVGHRGRILRCTGFTVIDDCYNANPSSMGAALESLAHCEGRPVCVLGDMLELGEESARLHRQLGEKAAALGMRVLACGPLAAQIAEGAGACAAYYSTVEELLPELKTQIRAGDTVLVKASRGMRFERICEALQAL